VINIHEKVINVIDKKNLKVDFMRLEKPCKNVKELSKLLKEKKDSFVKSVVFDDNGKRIVAIILGNDRVSFDKLSNATGSDTINILKPHEVMKDVGFPAGKVPPFGLNAEFLIDSKVLEKKYVFAGVGVEDGLMRISPNDILRGCDGKIVDVCD